MTWAALAPGLLLCWTELWPPALTLDHLWSIAGAAGARPPVADTCVLENQRAGRDVRHHSIVGAELVIAFLY
jgi:hypothetical protein